MEAVQVSENENNAIGLIQQALIFARNNSNEFFNTKLMKETTYEQHHLERLTNNYINHNKLSIRGQIMTTKITKEEYLKLDNGIAQDITRKFIQPHISRNQTALVIELQEKDVEGFYFDDIENFYMTDKEILDSIGSYDEDMSDQELINEVRNNGEDFKEIFEWYLVSDWFLERLREINEPVINNNYGEYWGRCGTGQAIYLDYNIQELAFEYASDERLYKKKEVA